MRYVTEADKKREQERLQDRAERLRWMTLVEAVKYIKDKQRCSDYEAVEDLLCAIVDGKVAALSGDISYEADTVSGYHLLSKSDLQRKVKVCLDGPGFIDLYASKPAEIFEYPKVSIVEGRIGKIVHDRSDPYTPPVFPEVDELEYGPVLVFGDDLEKWFASEDELHQVRSVPAGATKASDDAFSQENGDLAPATLPSSERLSQAHRRNAVKEAILAIWGTSGLPSGIMAAQRDVAVNDWLRANGRTTVGPRTIRRAVRELNEERR